MSNTALPSSLNDLPASLLAELLMRLETEVRAWTKTTSQEFTASYAWDPVSMLNGTGTSVTATVTGARPGDQVIAGFNLAIPGGVLVTAAVAGNDQAQVTLLNLSGGTVDLASGTLQLTAIRRTA